MLTGALLLGLILASAPLMALIGGDGGADEPLEDTPDDGGEGGQDRTDDLTDELPDEESEIDEVDGATELEEDEPEPLEDDEEEVSDLPVDYEYFLGRGDHAIEDFAPGRDTLTISSRTWNFSISTFYTKDDVPALQMDHEGGTDILRFPGLMEVPLLDIFVAVPDPVSGAVEVVPLAKVIEPEEADNPVLQPTDPDAQDTPPKEPSADPDLQPEDPDVPDDTPDEPSTSTPLAPTDPDAPER
jgi:hypothetical protein